MLMIHREGITNTFEDPFLPEEPSPLQTRAIDSCLWELHIHIHHYVPPVATLARILSEPFTKPSYLLEDFLDHTYDTVRVFYFL
jgi:U3 small nucleolar RNA-associated protein 19